MEASYSIIKHESEYRILLSPVKLDALAKDIQTAIVERNVDLICQVIKCQVLQTPPYVLIIMSME